MTKSVYTAGPMTNLTIGQADNWRTKFAKMISMYSLNQIDCYSPMRFKKHSWSKNLKDTDNIDLMPDESAILGSQRGLSARDRHDVLTCDLVFVNLLGSEFVSKGTLLEVGMVAAQYPQKTAVLLMEDGNCHDHPMLREYCSIHIHADLNKFSSKEEVENYYLDLSASVISSFLCHESV